MNEFMVRIWEENVLIPTYEVGKPDKNPMFFEKRIYQGSSGVVYPNPVIEKIYDQKEDKAYIGLFLENKYLKIMILPELGGRVQMAYDKIKERHFIYYNQVIKPALVGLTGPWISGGIEFNWPQHHRPSTFEPIDYRLEENADGSKTVWVNEIERMFGTKGMAGFTLHPNKAYLEIKAQLYNRSNLPQTFLWWANPAVKVNDYYQSVFPPDVNAVFDHGKRDVSTFPIATGTYYNVDYAPGTDISRYKNIPVPTSYMAINSAYDFMGGYEHDTQTGVLHVANHHVSPGKKQWTWGHSDFGQAWDRNLTDEDGPYIELMAGMFTDNQPDFTWIMPHEEKSFTQYFLPYQELGLVKNATKDILVNIVKHKQDVILKIYVTSDQPQLSIKLTALDEVLFTETANLSPLKVFSKTLNCSDNIDESSFLLIISNSIGNEIIRYEPALNLKNEMPKAAIPAVEPSEVENNEQLFLTGQHLEQYRHATYSAVPYYEEALKRDPKDIRNNNALGLWYLRRGQFKKAEAYFTSSIETSVSRNPNPYDGESYYNLGLCLQYQGRVNEAYNAFFKSSWNSAYQHSAYLFISQIDIKNANYTQALEHIDYSLDRNARNGKAYVVKSIILRKLNKIEDSLEVCEVGLKRDAFNIGLLFQKYLLCQTTIKTDSSLNLISEILQLSRGKSHSIIAYVSDIADCGMYNDAITLLTLALKSNTDPLVYYYLAYYNYLLNDLSNASENLSLAAAADTYLCFPNRLDDIHVLQYAVENNPLDAKAPYYLGNLWYDKRQYLEAIAQWELSLKRDAMFPTVLRNLGIAAYNKQGDAVKAQAYFEKAFNLDKTDARVLMELDQLYKRIQKSPAFRLQYLEDNLVTLEKRDDLYLERVGLCNITGQFEKAYQLIMQRQFHPWEGGEGKVSEQYLISLLELAKESIAKGDYEIGINKLNQAMYYPHNLGEGKLYGTQENDVFFYLGVCYSKLGNHTTSTEYFEKAAAGNIKLTSAMFYNDQQPDKLFYKGLALEKLGRNEQALELFRSFIAYGELNINNNVKIDYFAVSLPDLLVFEDNLNVKNKIHCHYITGLGYLGLKNYEKANIEFSNAQQLDNMNFGVNIHSRKNIIEN